MKLNRNSQGGEHKKIKEAGLRRDHSGQKKILKNLKVEKSSDPLQVKVTSSHLFLKRK